MMSTLDDLRTVLIDGERFAGDPEAVLSAVNARRGRTAWMHTSRLAPLAVSVIVVVVAVVFVIRGGNADRPATPNQTTSTSSSPVPSATMTYLRLYATRLAGVFGGRTYQGVAVHTTFGAARAYFGDPLVPGDRGQAPANTPAWVVLLSGTFTNPSPFTGVYTGCTHPPATQVAGIYPGPLGKPEGGSEISSAVPLGKGVSLTTLGTVIPITPGARTPEPGPATNTSPPSPPCLQPSATINLTLNGKTYHLQNGSAPDITLKIGQPLSITMSIDASPATTHVSDVWLYMAGNGGFGFGADAPTGNVSVLTHHPGTLASGAKITATWTPHVIYGTTKPYLVLEYGLGNTGLGPILAHFTLIK